ncbi:MAG: redoxin domain-containing protein [Puniceicoccales bacterium]|jgi:thiol-disulfide isomerase/thioredoxin|nr:redoxin domain-containing protein [Puniceicoccales bacterium]
MKNVSSLYRLLSAFLFATLLSLLSAFSNASAAAVPKAPEVGEDAPDFSFTDFDGKAHRLSEFRGKPVLLDIWATWCGPCIAEIPTLRAIHDELGNKGFVVLSVSIDDAPETAKAYTAKNNMPWTQGHSVGSWKSEIAQKFRVNAIPSVWFIGADGKIKANDLRGADAKAAARSLLQNKLNFTSVPKVKVSGLVVDEKGKPIAGATVFLLPISNVDACNYTGNLVEDWTFTTDANGVWTCEKMFADVKKLHIGVYHHNYFSSSKDTHDGSFEFEECASIPDLLAGKQKTVMISDGVRVTGIVRDTGGKPKAGVPVYIGHDRPSFLTPPEITNEKGEFSYAVRSSPAHFTITPEGFAPDMKIVEDAEKPAHIEFTLQPAHAIKGVLVDVNGKPLPEVQINIDGWRKRRSIHYRSESDSQGRFEVKNMPADIVLFGFRHKNFSYYGDVPLKAGKENRIVMIGETKVTGRVVDSETGEELKNYKLELGWRRCGEKIVVWPSDERNRKYYKERTNLKVSPTGVFNIVVEDRQQEYIFRVRMDGYTSEMSEIIESDGKEHKLVIKLKKGTRKLQEGETLITIKNSKGEALKDVHIIQGFEEDDQFMRYPTILVSNGKSLDESLYSGRVNFSNSNSDGTFLISETKENYRLSFLHPDGYKTFYSKDLKNGMTVVLTPWQTIRGKAFAGNKPNSGIEITYSYINRLVLWNNAHPRDDGSIREVAIVDENGNFEIKHAVPGLASISIKDGGGSKTIRVIEGKNNKVYLGLIGRPVKGRLIIPAELKGKKDSTYVYIERSDIEELPEVLSTSDTKLGKDDETLTEEEMDAKDIRFFERKERFQTRNFEMNEMSEDGFFLLKNVLPGKYVLELVDPFPVKRFFEVKLDSGKTFMKEPLDLGDLNFDADYEAYQKEQQKKPKLPVSENSLSQFSVH